MVCCVKLSSALKIAVSCLVRCCFVPPPDCANIAAQKNNILINYSNHISDNDKRKLCFFCSYSDNKKQNVNHITKKVVIYVSHNQEDVHLHVLSPFVSMRGSGVERVARPFQARNIITRCYCSLIWCRYYTKHIPIH